MTLMVTAINIFFIITSSLWIPSSCVSTLNSEATNVTFSEVTLNWDIDYGELSYEDYNHTLLCHLKNQYIEIYDCYKTKPNVTTLTLTDLKSGKPFLDCMFPISTEAQRYIAGQDCTSKCEDIVKQIKKTGTKEESTRIPNHNGTCTQYHTEYVGWGPQGIAAVITAAALILCLIIAQTISFLCPRHDQILKSKTDNGDEKSEINGNEYVVKNEMDTKDDAPSTISTGFPVYKTDPQPQRDPVSKTDSWIYSQIADDRQRQDAIIDGDLSDEEFDFQAVEPDDTPQWLDPFQYQNQGFQKDPYY